MKEKSTSSTTHSHQNQSRTGESGTRQSETLQSGTRQPGARMPAQRKAAGTGTQKKGLHFSEVQTTADTENTAQLQAIADAFGPKGPLPPPPNGPVQRQENKTGLPDQLKSGIEHLSGYSMDDVKVHYNSSRPAQLQAHAYAQGTDIHMAPGQEQHLPHEAWHVVQQKQGRVQPTKQLKGQTPVNDDAGLEHEADAMGAKAMSTAAQGNTDNPIGNEPSAIQPKAVQLKPVDDPKHAGFMMDDKAPWLKLKKLRDHGEDPKKTDFQLRNQLTPLYWQDSEEDTYYKDPDRTNKYDLEEAQKTHQFGAWMETYQETLKEHGRIEGLEELNGIKKEEEPDKLREEKERVKNAISMYLLQSFMTNALFREDEIERLDYQTTPLNYQKDSNYLRSFATSFTNALERTLPKHFDHTKLFLTRTEDMGDVLKQFFEVLRVESDEKVDLTSVEAGLKTTIDRSANYLYYSSEKDMSKYWEDPGNTQAYVDVTEKIKALTDDKKHEVVVSLGNTVQQVYLKAVAKKLVALELEKNELLKDREDKATIEKEINGALSTYLDRSELLEVENDLNGNKKPSVLGVTYESYLEGFGTWLAGDHGLGKISKIAGKIRDNAEAGIKGDAHKYTPTGEDKQNFKQIVKEKEFQAYITFKQNEGINFTVEEGKESFKALKEKLKKAIGTTNMVVTTGSMVGITSKDDKYTQSGIIIDDKAMGMAVKTAINKSGNVPSPTDSSRKMLQNHPLSEIVQEIISQQKNKGSKKGKEGVNKLEERLKGFKPETYTSLGQVDEQLKKTREALTGLKDTYKEDVTNLKIEIDAVVKLLEGTGTLADETPLPGFVLRQLQMHLEEAVLGRNKMEDVLRNIQGMHEAVILKLELEGTSPEKYDFGAPQHKTDLSDKDDYFQGSHLADYGLKAFSQAYNAVLAQAKANTKDGLSIQAFYNIYFEVHQKLSTTSDISKNKVTLQSPSSIEDYIKSENYKGLEAKATGVDLIMIDIHPNDATKKDIKENDVPKLINDVFGELRKRDDYKNIRLTVMVDITLNHTTEEEIKAIRESADEYISSGNLNLVFVQSLTKFAQLGMDKESGGLAFAYNKGEDWKAFNESMKESQEKDPVDPTIQKYFQALFKHTSKEQVDYLKAVRASTKSLHQKIKSNFEKMGIKDDALTITDNQDEGTCYVSIRYDDFIARIFNNKTYSDEDVYNFNMDVLENGINKIMGQLGLPVTMRMSFGFPLSNLGDTGKEVRFTIGIEDEQTLQDYADTLSYVNYELARAVNEGTDLTNKGKRSEVLSDMSGKLKKLQDLRDKVKEFMEVELLEEDLESVN
ncbi:DUF4157 domain-containing protein [Roseivirga sp. BDSF3-8]|uniref:eCIS core domain-containing protein n=1 Tax=Roseivirga sp. BDSF3-8 TaxID=3241598 RepID=UPI0035318849